MALVGRLFVGSFSSTLNEGTNLLEEDIENRLTTVPGFHSVWRFHDQGNHTCGFIARWQSEEFEEAGFRLLEPYIVENAKVLGGGDIASYRFEYSD